ncbi:MAG TPA: 3-oxoadipate enol-lactonase [Rugosimonospora sp.]|nr:3-oxoadipate enol-lactonase [Rugosimonospora sp.]
MPFIDVNGVCLRYRLEGKPGAPVIVFSNSLGTNLSMWEPQVSALRGDFRILRYDTRGHGLSAVAPGPYTQEQLGGDILALMDAIEIPRAHFCGLSMGGQVGIWLGANAPQRFARLVLCDTAAHIGNPEIWNARIAAIRAGGMPAIVSGTIERWFTPRFIAHSPEVVAPVRRMILDTPPQGYIACCEAIRDADFTEEASRVNAPTLVISGTHDPATPPAQGRLLASMIRGARYLEFDAAHLSNIEAAPEFTAAVGDFLSAAAVPAG